MAAPEGAPRVCDHWRRSLRRYLAQSWRWWLRPDTTGFGMACGFAVFAWLLHRSHGLLGQRELATIQRADDEAIAWLRHWSLFRAAAKACRDLEVDPYAGGEAAVFARVGRAHAFIEACVGGRP